MFIVSHSLNMDLNSGLQEIDRSGFSFCGFGQYFHANGEVLSLLAGKTQIVVSHCFYKTSFLQMILILC